MKTRVVVTGAGVISSIGQSVVEFGESLRAGRSGIGFLGGTISEESPIRIGAAIQDFRYEERLRTTPQLPPDLKARALQCARRSPLTVQCAVSAALEAWLMAGLPERSVVPDRIALIVAGSNLSQHYQYRLLPKFQQAPEYLPPSYALQYFDSDIVGTVSEVLAIYGEGFTAGGASASGNVGIVKGYQLLQLGAVDLCLVVGAAADLSPMELWGFHNIGALGGMRLGDQPDQACRPFDTGHEGFLPGQACGCLVLESLPSAQKRGAAVLAELLGGAIVLDGNRLSDPREEGEAKAMQSALRQAELAPEAVDYINAHGTSTPSGDIAELQAIKRAFPQSYQRVWVNSTKELTGHTLFAAGVVEAIATIIQLRDGFLHPNKNLRNPIDSDFRFVRDGSVETVVDIAMSNSFGFGGINTSVILKKGV